MKKLVMMLAEINQYFACFSLQPSPELKVKLKCILSPPTERGLSFLGNGEKRASDAACEDYPATWATALQQTGVFSPPILFKLTCPQAMQLLKITVTKSVSLK